MEKPKSPWSNGTQYEFRVFELPPTSMEAWASSSSKYSSQDDINSYLQKQAEGGWELHQIWPHFSETTRSVSIVMKKKHKIPKPSGISDQDIQKLQSMTDVLKKHKKIKDESNES